jgi:branched-chain amino acid transport system substrate-binding protein
MYVAYWNPNLDAKSAAFFKEFLKRRHIVPSDFQVGTYSVVHSYLLAVAATHSVDPKIVLAQMRKMKVDDAFTSDGVLRPDGRMVHDLYLLQVKTPAESKSKYDWTKVIATIPGNEVFRPIDAPGGCPAFAKK